MIRALTLLVCALVVLARVDRLPDPPAARPDYSQLKNFNSGEQPANFTAPGPFLAGVTRQLVSEPGLSVIPRRVSRDNQTIVVRRAADSSPPRFPHARLFLQTI